LRRFLKFNFWKINLGFKGKSGLLAAFSKAFSKAINKTSWDLVLEMAQKYNIYNVNNMETKMQSKNLIKL
jgi:hypothetical protein